MKEFKVNEYITLKLEKGKSIIYIKGKRFLQCFRLFINIPKDKIMDYKQIDSIDDATEVYDKYLYENKVIKGKDLIQVLDENPLITPEQEFWGHCSNLQSWAENNYDTRILHSNLAFPLLKKLTEIGDPLAKKVFKEEIARRIESGYPPVITYLYNQGYLRYLNKEEFEGLKIDSPYKALFYLEKKFKLVWVEAGMGHPGYEFGSKGKITTLRLKSKYLKTIPEEVFTLDSLEVLNLANNNLENIPKSIIKLSKLQRIYISSNKFLYFPTILLKLKSLKFIDIHNNSLKKIPVSINDLQNLERLELDSNDIRNLPPSILKLKNLKVLDIRSNPKLKISNNFLKALEENKVTVIHQEFVKRGI